MSSARVASKYGKGLTGLFKKFWDEMPEVVGSTALGLVGLGIGVYIIRDFLQKGEFIPKYKESYVVYRHDDPKIALIKP